MDINNLHHSVKIGGMDGQIIVTIEASMFYLVWQPYILICHNKQIMCMKVVDLFCMNATKQITCKNTTHIMRYDFSTKAVQVNDYSSFNNT